VTKILAREKSAIQDSLKKIIYICEKKVRGISRIIGIEG
jgi:hypothetical protein